MERKSEVASRHLRFPATGLEHEYHSARRFREHANWSEPEPRGERLSEILVDEIVPRLRLLHHGIRAVAPPADQLGLLQIAEFAALAMLSDSSGASHYFDEMRARDLSIETLFIGLLAPTARYLEELLDQDRCDLIDFTMGITRLQQFLAIFDTTELISVSAIDHRALLVTMPEEKQVFDRDLIAALMRRVGWETSVDTYRGAKDAASLVCNDWFGILSVTLGRRSGLEAAATMISAVKRASLNISIRVMVSGRVFTADPALAVQIGADASAPDAASAVATAEKLVRNRAAA
jgi:hypothetical protein